MSLNPLKELKRRLENDETPLPKRLCLARNVVSSHHFATAPKEHLIGEWLQSLILKNELSSKHMKDFINWTNVADDFSNELKSKLIQIVSEYVIKNKVQPEEVHNFISFIENPKLSNQFISHIDEYLQITIALINVFNTTPIKENASQIQRILTNISKTYKDCRRKLEFIEKLTTVEKLETVFNLLDTECRTAVINMSQMILFPISKKPFFLRFLQAKLGPKGDSGIKTEKGDNMQSVLKIMNTFYDNLNTVVDLSEEGQRLVANFINIFVCCFKTEGQLIFAFYISLDGKINPSLLLSMLKFLQTNEVDVTVKFTGSFSEKLATLEAKNTFMIYLHRVMISQLCLCSDSEITKYELVKTVLKLDPTVTLEREMDLYLPDIMAAKKKSTTVESYSETLNYLIEVLFKLSRGTTFVRQILPKLKQSLEKRNGNTDLKSGKKSKMATGNDVFPDICVEQFGKWTSELMFRQNKDFLASLQEDFEHYCLGEMEDGSISGPTITLTEVMSAILSSFLRHNKMADHTVPVQVADEFWEAYQRFEQESLKKFGKCLLELNYNQRVHQSFLRLCTSCVQLKLINLKYSNTKVASPASLASEVYDLSDVLPCLDTEQWTAICERTGDNVDELNKLLLLKTIFLDVIQSTDNEQLQSKSIRTHFVKQVSNEINILNNDDFAKVLIPKLDKKQARQLSEILIVKKLENPELNVTDCDALLKNNILLNALVLEISKNISKCFENSEKLAKVLKKHDFDFISFARDVNLRELFNELTLKDDQEEKISLLLEVLKELPICYLEESYQLVAIFLLMATKMCCHKKKIRKTIDSILHSIFEVSSKCPDVYKLFPVDFIFSFNDGVVLNLLVLKNKVSNDMFVVKKVLESGVKKVKTEPEIVNKIVELLLEKQANKQTSRIEFSELTFQISCIILPIIVKEKKAITTSAYRSILAALQEKLHLSMLEAFKVTDFKNSSFSFDTTGNTDESMVESDNAMATLSAIGAYTLTLSKYCETTDAEEVKNLDCLWSGLDFFFHTAIKTLQTSTSKPRHVESSIQLLNIVLRHIKKLESHELFNEKDKTYLLIWKAIMNRVNFDIEKEKHISSLEELSVTLKFVSELISVDGFVNNMVADLTGLFELKNTSEKKTEVSTQLTSLKAAKYLFTQCLKANIVGQKCSAISRLTYKMSKDLRTWLDQSLENQEFNKKYIKSSNDVEITVKITEEMYQVVRMVLDSLAEAILTAKKITLDYRSLDSTFDLLHRVGSLLASPTVDWESWEGFLTLFEGCVVVLNNFLVSREELLEDRWPCYLQVYRVLVRAVAATRTDTGLAVAAHSIEKLTQSICKRKAHMSKIAAYIVADICSLLEQNAPSKIVRQHLENSVALFIQVSDTNNAMTFLRRALVGNAGQMTMTNLYTMYKRYHKYVGNS